MTAQVRARSADRRKVLLAGCLTLVVDDSAVVRAAVRVALQAQGAEVLEAADAELAITALAARPEVDVVLLDVELPGRDGFDVAPELIACGPSVVFLTGRSWGEDVALAFELGAVDYLRKPFDQVELVARVRAAHRLKAAQDELRRLALTDALTGTANRRRLTERLDALVSRSRRHGHPLSVLLLDLDGFKQLNDVHGHRVGDAALTAVARTIAGRIRAEDELGRWGGDELLLLLPDTDDASAAVLEAALLDLRVDHDVDGAPLPAAVALSAGRAQWQPGLSVEGLVHQADMAMYRRKRARLA